MTDGYYTAEARDFDEQGWKEFITIYVYNNEIRTVEYNAKNSSGFIKSWDIEFQRQFKKKYGRSFKYYIRSYTLDLLEKQEASGIRPKGEARYYATFKILAASAISQARLGDKSIVRVSLQLSE